MNLFYTTFANPLAAGLLNSSGSPVNTAFGTPLYTNLTTTTSSTTTRGGFGAGGGGTATASMAGLVHCSGRSPITTSTITRSGVTTASGITVTPISMQAYSGLTATTT